MNRITSLLVQLIGVKRPKPRTRFGRYLRRSERVITCLLLLYLGLHLFPEVIFAHSLTERGITLYSREPLPPEAAACARRAAELVGHSELARIIHNVRRKDATRALISEGNSHFGWGGMPTTVCRNQV